MQEQKKTSKEMEVKGIHAGISKLLPSELLFTFERKDPIVSEILSILSKNELTAEEAECVLSEVIDTIPSISVIGSQKVKLQPGEGSSETMQGHRMFVSIPEQSQ